MELSLSKLPWYGQIGAFVVVCARRRVRLLELLRARSAEPTSRCARRDLTALRARHRQGLATARRLPEFEAQVTELEGRLESLRAVLPEEKDVADILRRLQGLATQSNLTIQRFTPQPSVQQAMYAEVPFKLQAEGTYHNLGAVLRPDQQVPANHQRQRHHHQGQPAAGAELHDHRRVHRHHVRAARGCCGREEQDDGAEAAVDRKVSGSEPRITC